MKNNLDRYYSFESHILTGCSFIGHSNRLLTSDSSREEILLTKIVAQTRKIVSSLNENRIHPNEALDALEKLSNLTHKESKVRNKLSISWILHARALAFHKKKDARSVISTLVQAVAIDSELYLLPECKFFIDSHYMLVSRLVEQSVISNDDKTFVDCIAFVFNQILPENKNMEKDTARSLYMSRTAESLTSARRKMWLLSLPTNQIIGCLIMSTHHRRLIKNLLSEHHNLISSEYTLTLSKFLNGIPSTTAIEYEIQETYPYNSWLLNLLIIDDELGIKLDRKYKNFAKSLCLKTFPSHYIPKKLLVYLESLL